MTIHAIHLSDSRELCSIEREDIAQATALDRRRQCNTVVFQSLLKSMCIQEHFIDKQVSLSASRPCVSSFNTQATEFRYYKQPNDHVTVVHTAALEHDAISSSSDEFITSIWPYACHAAYALGLDPKLLVAQAVLETGWGKAIAKDSCGTSNNLFNIKASAAASSNHTVSIKTTEYIADAPTTLIASFKKYPSIEHSFNDYVSLIKNNDRYRHALAYAHDSDRYIEAIHQAGYATDPQYANKLLAIYKGNQLSQALVRHSINSGQ
jgi:peptidoglycan hydrolase FlgJ